MADAKQCDRCGVCYVQREATAYEALANTLERVVKTIVAPKSLKTETQCVIERIVDLCPDCSESLTEWLNNKEKGNG